MTFDLHIVSAKKCAELTLNCTVQYSPQRLPEDDANILENFARTIINITLTNISDQSKLESLNGAGFSSGSPPLEQRMSSR